MMSFERFKLAIVLLNLLQHCNFIKGEKQVNPTTSSVRKFCGSDESSNEQNHDCTTKSTTESVTAEPAIETTCSQGYTTVTSENYKTSCPNSANSISRFKIPQKDNYTSVLTDSDRFKINLQNKQLLSSLIKAGVYGKLVPEHEPKLGFRLLETSVEIYAKLCQAVPSDFLDNAYKIFHELHFSTSDGRTDVLQEIDYKWILKLVMECYTNATGLEERMDERCKEEYLAVGNCTDFICTKDPYEFQLYRTDPLVDIVWKVYELVHAKCFEYFEESYRMFHKFAQSQLDLWTGDIKLRWFNQLADDRFWKRVLGPNYEVHLINMERCNEAIIANSSFPYRLGKETVPTRTRLHGNYV